MKIPITNSKGESSVPLIRELSAQGMQLNVTAVFTLGQVKQTVRKMITYCQERDVDVLLTYLPFPASENAQREANQVFDIAREYNVNYLDYQKLRELVDFDIDCYDPDSHLDPSGARKVIAYIGQYIMEHYGLSDQRGNELYKDWHEAYEEYTQFKIDNIKAQNAIKPYLMLLSDKNISFSIYIKEGSALTDKVIVRKLLENTGIAFIWTEMRK